MMSLGVQWWNRGCCSAPGGGGARRPVGARPGSEGGVGGLGGGGGKGGGGWGGGGGGGLQPTECQLRTCIQTSRVRATATL